MQQESRELHEQDQNGEHKDTEEKFYEEYSKHDIADSYEVRWWRRRRVINIY